MSGAMTAVLPLLQLSTQGGAATPRSIVELILTSDPVTKAVLGGLAVLSLLSWAIMFAKWRTFSVAESSVMIVRLASNGPLFGLPRSSRIVTHAL